MNLHTRRTIRKNSGKFARGTYALFDCERCGLTYKYSEMQFDPNTGLKVCADCVDLPDPPIFTYTDAEALKHATLEPEFANNYYRELQLGEYLSVNTGTFTLTINALGDLTLLDIDRIKLYGVPIEINDIAFTLDTITSNIVVVNDSLITPDTPTIYTKLNSSIKYELYKA